MNGSGFAARIRIPSFASTSGVASSPWRVPGTTPGRVETAGT